MPTLDYFDLVALGGGVASGYWAEEVASLLKAGAVGGGGSNARPRICIISAYPDGLVPYERSDISKGCLRPTATHSRDWQAWGNKTFPFTSSGNDREARYVPTYLLEEYRTARWYRDNGVTVLSWCECYEVDVASATLKLYQYSERVRTPAKAKQVEVVYGSLLIATGSSPRRLDGDTEGQSPCFCRRHPDLKGARLEKPDRYGLGSAHYLRDMGDCIKLTKALGTLPAGGGTGAGGAASVGGDANTVILVGGGLLCVEVAAAIVTHYPGVRPVILMDGARLLHDFFDAELSRFYESKLAAAGVTIVRYVVVERLWGLEEQGEFETLGGNRVHFGPAPRGFTECRGVVLRSRDDLTIHVPARMVLIGIGSVPNSEVFRGKLELSGDGGIMVDPHCRAKPSRSTAVANAATNGASLGAVPRVAAVYAVGDVANYPLALEGSRRVRHEHVQNARDMAVVAARNMVALVASAESNDGVNMRDAPVYQPVPGFSSKFLGLSFRFYGLAEGDVVVLGASEFRTTRTLGAFWVRDERVVGAFLEGGTLEQQIAVAQVARLRPRVFSAKMLKESALGDFLEDPGSIEASEDSDLAQLLMCCRCV